MGRNIKYSPTAFVKLWLSDMTSAEAAKKLGMSTVTFSKTAKRLRDMGVKPPKRSTAVRSTETRPVNVDGLNNLIDQLAKK